MKNYHSKGETISLTPTVDGKSGDIVIVGDLAGAALSDHTAGTPTPVRLEGVVELPKAAEAIAEGVTLYATAAKVVTATSSGNTRIGNAVSSAASGDAAVLCKLGR